MEVGDIRFYRDRWKAVEEIEDQGDPDDDDDHGEAGAIRIPLGVRIAARVSCVPTQLR